MTLAARLRLGGLFGTVALLLGISHALLWRPESYEHAFITRVSPSGALALAWPGALAAFGLGAALAGLFVGTARRRWGVLSAACLGCLIVAPAMYLTLGQLNTYVFAVTFETFLERSAASADTHIVGGVSSSPFVWFVSWLLSGALAGNAAWLRKR